MTVRSIMTDLTARQDTLTDNANKLDTIKIGSEVWVRPAFGTLPAILVTVIGIWHISNERPGIDYTIYGGFDTQQRWAYLDHTSLTR